MAILKVDNVSFTYPNETTAVLKNINIDIEQGEFVVLMGQSWMWKKHITAPFQT